MSIKGFIQRGTFQGDALSLLLLVIVTMSPNHILKKCACGYKLRKLKEKINHRMKKGKKVRKL